MTNSASIAKLRLLKDSIEQKKLAELKQDAAELGLTSSDVKLFGTLTLKQTWIDAIGDKIAQLFDAVEGLQGGAIAQHESDRSDVVSPESDSTDTTITQVEMIVSEENLPHLPLSSFRVPDEEIYTVDEPPNEDDENEDEEDEDEDDEDTDDEDDEDEDEDDDSYLVAGLPQEVIDSLVDAGVVNIPGYEDEDEDDEDTDDEDDEDEDEEEFDLATLKAIAITPQVRAIVKALPRLNYYQLTALHYGILLAHQDVQPVAYAMNLLGYSDRFSPEQTFSLNLHEFVPERDGRTYLIRIIKGLKTTQAFAKPENCCPTCDGLGNIFAGIAEHLIDWETCDVCGGKGFLDPVPNPVACPDCDGTGEVIDFSGEGDEPCSTCEGKRFVTDPKTEPKLSQPEVKVNVRVCYPDTDQNSKTIIALAKTFGGVCWCAGFTPEGFEENWSFNSFQGADSFMQSCLLLPFVKSAFCDRVSSNVPLSPPPDPTITQASELEKATVIEWFRAEGSSPEELEQVRRQPMTKAEAMVVLGFAEHFKKSAEIALRLYLVDWVNECANRTDLTFLLSWKFISEAKAKLAYQFQLRPGEINCFITPDGWRISCPAWTKEEILTPKEAEFINPDDAVIQLMGDGYLLAMERFKDQVSMSLVDVSPFPLPHETSLA